MSVLIKGVDMPKFCGVNECPLCSLGWREKNRYTEWCHRPNGGGFVMVGYHNEENKIPDDCPLLEVHTAQPERLTDDDSETIRIHLNACKEKLCNQRRWKEAEEYQRIIDRFMACAHAQPTVDIEPVRHAKNVGTDYDEVDQFVCSECGIELQDWCRVERDEDDGEETYHEYRIRYCPNCGAMVVEEDAGRKEE